MARCCFGDETGPLNSNIRLPSLGQGDQGKAAESEFTAAASDNKTLNPTACSAGLDEEVQSVSVGVSSGWSGAQVPGAQSRRVHGVGS